MLFLISVMPISLTAAPENFITEIFRGTNRLQNEKNLNYGEKLMCWSNYPEITRQSSRR